MLDEMDLLRDLRNAEPVRPRAFDEARTVLRAEMAAQGASETTTGSRRRTRWGKRRMVGFSAAALVAASAAAALVITSTPTADKPPAKAAQATENPILAKLVANITPLQANAPGDATLEIRNQSPTSDELGANGIGLFTDDGTYYWGVDKSALRRAILRKDGGDEVFKRAIAVALYAVKGDIGTARARMAVANIAPGTNPDPERTKIEKLKAVAKARGEKYVPPKPPTPEQQKEITDNHIWNNAIDALIAAPENPQVRAGVLRIMATMPKVKVTKTTTAGQPTLTLVDSWPNTSGKFVEKLVINAGTGHPVALSSSGSDVPSRTTYYHNSRVTLADIRAGKF
ncbi:hypothetical protein [Actinomadura rudentiformis]|uniref:CU044_5270 family protein n=1 Tax=Actinomadura rudentiformis TaxID=359158 RepID=A0A6H9YZK9_9ACTN|nr:hypothetical protein [Actinomadura rudentiformis]KAB2352270.1 hypothetical protein F8566_00760 [Actinomadura rudentiformis]